MSTSGVSDLQTRQLRTAAGKLLRPTGVLAETNPRHGWSSSQGYLASQQQSFVGIWLEAGMVVTSITFVSGTTVAGTPLNQWFSLYDADRNLLAVTADDTTTAWGANSPKTLALTAPYTILTSGMYYLGIMVRATTVPTIAGILVIVGITTLAPISSGRDTTNTTLTTPATAPNPAAALTPLGVVPYAHIT